MLRKTFFWLHLGAGLIAGLVVAVMCFTGAALAFEKELTAWAERDFRRVTPPAEISNPKPQNPNSDFEVSNPKSEIENQKSTRIPLRDLLTSIREKEPEARPTSVTVSADPTATIAITFGRDNVYYANPYTGELRKPASTRMHDFMHLMETWHRFLGLSDESSRPVGKAITGASNLAFLFLAVSGLYLWWPRNWSWRGFKALAVFNLRLTGKARDFNWHNSIGLWNAPILIVLTLTAVPMSYRWGNDLVYHLTGTESPVQNAGPGPGGASPAIVVPPPEPGTKPLNYDFHLASIQRESPLWSEITFRLGNARGQGGSQRRESSPSSNSEKPKTEIENQKPASPRSQQAINVTVRTADQWPFFSTTTLALDPFTGAVLKKETFADQNAGRRLRSWTRFLHTGEALGWPGKLLAALASFSTLLLIWTGLALSWRRLKMRKQDS